MNTGLRKSFRLHASWDFWTSPCLPTGPFLLDLEGVTFIVTIDGTRDAHNAIRGGTYGAILSHVREAKSKVLASITISKANVRDLEEAVQQIAATHLFHGITFNLLTHNPEVVVDMDFLVRKEGMS